MKKGRARTGLLLLSGAVGLWLFIDHICGWKEAPYFYRAHPGILRYAGVNVVSPWADFSYFTYITLILFSVWALLTALSRLTGCGRLEAFLRSNTVVTFTETNYLLTAVLYTLFEVAFGGAKFGLYSTTAPLAWHNLGTNLTAHYLLFAAAMYLTETTKVTKPVTRGGVGLISAFLVVYVAAVKITGMTVYRIEWYPYVIFDHRLFGEALGLRTDAAAIALLALTFVLIVAAYGGLFYFLAVRHRKKAKVAVSAPETACEMPQ